jgi:transcriptional regulator with XRE-family HTH domain
MESVKRRFGRRIREPREEKGWSQEAFAEECGLHRTYIGGIERGERNVGLVNVERIAVALRVSIADLFEQKGADATRSPDRIYSPRSRRRPKAHGLS